MLCNEGALGATGPEEAGAAGGRPSLETEVYLLSANVEAEIARYLLANGVAIDPKSRQFLANLRDVMGALAKRTRAAV